MAVPQAHVCIRIFRFLEDILIYEDFFLSDENGQTNPIPLFVAEDSEPIIYQVEAWIKNNKTKQVYEAIIYAGELSLLQVESIDSESINRHTLYEHVDTDRFYFFHQDAKLPVPFFLRVQPQEIDQQEEPWIIPFLTYLKTIVCIKMNPTTSHDTVKDCTAHTLQLILRRVASHRYPSRGYGFDLYEKEENLLYERCHCQYATVNTLVDEVFSAWYEHRYLKQRNDIGNLWMNDRILQQELYGIALYYPAVQPIRKVDGQWNAQSCATLNTFARLFHMQEKGRPTPALRQTIHEHSAILLKALFPPLTKQAVQQTPEEQQRLLHLLAMHYSSIPDSIHPSDEEMCEQYKAVQRLLGLDVNGILTPKLQQLIQQMGQELSHTKEIKTL